MKENKSHSGKKKTEEIQEELTRLNKFLLMSLKRYLKQIIDYQNIRF